MTAGQRHSVESAIRETCVIRHWSLQAINVRTNHAHTVVTANRKASLVLNAFKANATRHLREDGLWPHNFSPWADKGSKRRLWNESSVARAIDYVLYGQGDDLPYVDDEDWYCVTSRSVVMMSGPLLPRGRTECEAVIYFA